MVLKKLLGSLGVGGPTVDTVLEPGAATPGGSLTGQVRLKGGSADCTIEQITLELVAVVEAERDEGEYEGAVTFAHFAVAGGFVLTAEADHSIPFTVTLPWETPVTELHGQDLGVVLGVRTELAVAGARDKGDLDRLTVTALPAQEAVLEALGRLGFGFRSADLELGHIRGSGQQLPFYQEIELSPAPQYADRISEIEVTFLAGAETLEVVLEADKRAGLHPEGDTLSRFVIGRHESLDRDWVTEVDGWIRTAAAGRPPHDTHETYGASETYGHGEARTHSGHGLGGAAAAGAAGLAVGVVGGMVAAEVVDEVGDFFEGDEDEEEEGDEEG
ncbi:sporulation protein [Streptomyces sp. NPDC047737]|jgi:sporulation-control protein|uniref:sporulation protein n=1 Tax=unclassified Streptomyces TaxID=2593676 RepID=UPI0034051160